MLTYQNFALDNSHNFYKYGWNKLLEKSNLNFIIEFPHTLKRPRFETIIRHPIIEKYLLKENVHKLFSPHYERYPK